MGVLKQVLATGIACYLCMSMGIMFTWPSCTLKIFESANTTLHRPMGETELALFGSLSSVGAMISTPVTGYFLDIVGRKYSAIAASLMHVVAWSMIAASNQVEVVLVAIFISGLGGAAFLIVPMLVSEVSQESIRGAMTSSYMIFYALGMLLSYLLGGYVEYNVMIYICLSISVVGVVLLVFLKETPTFLMKKGLDEEAAKSIAFYRSKSPESKEVQQEMAALRRAFNPDLDGESDVSPEEEKFQPPENKEAKKLSLWRIIKKSRETRQAIFVTMTLATASTFQGLTVVQVYAEPLFLEAVPTWSPTVCSAILAIVTVVIGMVTAYCTEMSGRRPLMIYSSAAAGVCCALLGTQMQLHWAPHWLTAVLIYLFCSVYTMGAGTVPYIIAAEVFLPEIKSIIFMVVVEWVWLCNFVILFIFNPLVSAVGLGPVFYIFAAICFLSAVFTVIYLPETKGLPMDEIPMLFSKRKRGEQKS